MSHFSRVKVAFQDQAAIVAALQSLLGVTATVHQQPVKIFDYVGRYAPDCDSQITVSQQQLKDVGMYAYGQYCSAPKAAEFRLWNDIGFQLREDGSYEIITDGSQAFHDAFAKEYAKQVVILQAQKLGQKFTVTETADGGYRIEVTIPQTTVKRAGSSTTTTARSRVGNR